MIDILGHSLQEIGPISDKVCFKHASITKLPYDDGKFDTIFCISVLEHMSIDKKGLKL